jgi:hypothetical protein
MERARSSSDSRPPGHVLTLLVVGVLVLLGALLFVVVAPSLECPECKGGRHAVFTLNEKAPGTAILGCPTCNDRHRVTLIQKWKYQKAEETR